MKSSVFLLWVAFLAFFAADDRILCSEIRSVGDALAECSDASQGIDILMEMSLLVEELFEDRSCSIASSTIYVFCVARDSLDASFQACKAYIQKRFELVGSTPLWKVEKKVYKAFVKKLYTLHCSHGVINSYFCQYFRPWFLGLGMQLTNTEVALSNFIADRNPAGMPSLLYVLAAGKAFLRDRSLLLFEPGGVEVYRKTFDRDVAVCLRYVDFLSEEADEALKIKSKAFCVQIVHVNNILDQSALVVV